MLGKALSMVEHAQPIVVVLENVRGFLSVGGGDYFSWLGQRLASIGYGQLHYKVLGSHQFGVPQKRMRLYMVAIRDDVDAADFSFPVGDDTLTPTLAKFLKKRQLAKRFSNTIRCGGRGSKDKHAWDMVPRTKNAGWYQLTVADCKALMGFPKDFDMPVPRTHQFRLLGNAITIEPGRSILTECRRVVEEAYRHSMRAKA